MHLQPCFPVCIAYIKPDSNQQLPLTPPQAEEPAPPPPPPRSPRSTATPSTSTRSCAPPRAWSGNPWWRRPRPSSGRRVSRGAASGGQGVRVCVHVRVGGGPRGQGSTAGVSSGPRQRGRRRPAGLPVLTCSPRPRGRCTCGPALPAPVLACLKPTSGCVAPRAARRRAPRGHPQCAQGAPHGRPDARDHRPRARAGAGGAPPAWA